MKFKYFIKFWCNPFQKVTKGVLVKVVLIKILGWYPCQTSNDPFKRLSSLNLSPIDLKISLNSIISTVQWLSKGQIFKKIQKFSSFNILKYKGNQ